MKLQLESIKKTRRTLLEYIKDLNAEQLNKIPVGFNNNIIWNLTHLIAAQQGLCYMRAGLPVTTDAYIWDEYRSGTSPVKFIDAPEVAHIKHLMFSTIDKLEADLNSAIFNNYVPWKTRYDVELRSIDDALNFVLYHEGLHAGYVMALKRVVDSKF